MGLVLRSSLVSLEDGVGYAVDAIQCGMPGILRMIVRWLCAVGCVPLVVVGCVPLVESLVVLFVVAAHVC